MKIRICAKRVIPVAQYANHQPEAEIEIELPDNTTSEMIQGKITELKMIVNTHLDAEEALVKQKLQQVNVPQVANQYQQTALPPKQKKI